MIAYEYKQGKVVEKRQSLLLTNGYSWKIDKHLPQELCLCS